MTHRGRPRTFDEAETERAARDVFWLHGYASTSMRDLGDQLNVLPGSLYHAFGDKQALFLRGLQHYAEDGRRAVAALVTGDPVLPRLRDFLAEALVAAAAHPGRGCLLGNTAVEVLPAEGPVAELVHKGFEQLEAGITTALTAAQQRGELRAGVDVAAQAQLLLALQQGLHILARAEEDPMRLMAAVDAAILAITAPAGPAAP